MEYISANIHIYLCLLLLQIQRSTCWSCQKSSKSQLTVVSWIYCPCCTEIPNNIFSPAQFSSGTPFLQLMSITEDCLLCSPTKQNSGWADNNAWGFSSAEAALSAHHRLGARLFSDRLRRYCSVFAVVLKWVKQGKCAYIAKFAVCACLFCILNF